MENVAPMRKFRDDQSCLGRIRLSRLKIK